MATLQPYKNYHAVAYDYATQLPEGWQLLPNIAIFEERIERGHINEELLSVTIKKGVIRQTDVAIKKDSSNEDKSKYKLIKVGDIAYNKMRMWQGALGYSDYQGISSPAYVILKPKMEINPRFFHYMLRTSFYTNYSKRFSYGIVDDQLSLRYIDFKRMYSIVPPLEVQNSIVDYLDKKNNEIDKFIRNKERLIELLEEERNYMVETALFFGMTKNVETKITKVNYLPNIPVHWDLHKIKHIAKINPGKPTKYSKNSLEEVVFLPMERVSENGKISNELKLPIKDVWTGYTFFAKNDIVMAKITPCFENGKGAFLDELETDIGFGTTEFHVLRAGRKVKPFYLYNILRTNKFKILGKENMQGSAGQQRVPLDFLKNFPVGIPPLNEQLEIIRFIEKINEKTELIFSKAQQEITSIKEYREALITDLVTGKRSIPQIQSS